MKTEKQIRERIDFLESRDVDSTDTIRALNYCILEKDIVLRICASTMIMDKSTSIQYIRTILWVLED